MDNKTEYTKNEKMTEVVLFTPEEFKTDLKCIKFMQENQYRSNGFYFEKNSTLLMERFIKHICDIAKYALKEPFSLDVLQPKYGKSYHKKAYLQEGPIIKPLIGNDLDCGKVIVNLFLDVYKGTKSKNITLKRHIDFLLNNKEVEKIKSLGKEVSTLVKSDVNAEELDAYCNCTYVSRKPKQGVTIYTVTVIDEEYYLVCKEYNSDQDQKEVNKNNKQILDLLNANTTELFIEKYIKKSNKRPTLQGEDLGEEIINAHYE